MCSSAELGWPSLALCTQFHSAETEVAAPLVLLVAEPELVEVQQWRLGRLLVDRRDVRLAGWGRRPWGRHHACRGRRWFLSRPQALGCQRQV